MTLQDILSPRRFFHRPRSTSAVAAAVTALTITSGRRAASHRGQRPPFFDLDHLVVLVSRMDGFGRGGRRPRHCFGISPFLSLPLLFGGRRHDLFGLCGRLGALRRLHSLPLLPFPGRFLIWVYPLSKTTDLNTVQWNSRISVSTVNTVLAHDFLCVYILYIYSLDKQAWEC